MHKLSMLLFLFLLCSCGAPGTGGGGGGGEDYRYDPLKGAFLTVRATPSSTKIGDRISVTVSMEGVNNNGALIKLRFPNSFTYEADSSFLITDEETVDIGPAIGPATQDTLTYLVYLISREALPRDNRGEITLTLRAKTALESGTIEVDDDIYTPEVSLTKQFNYRKPLFGAEDSASVAIN